MPTLDEIRIRNVDADIALKLTSMAKKRGMTRSEYIKSTLTSHVYSREIKEIDDRYQELFKIVIEVIEGNSQLLREILLKMEKSSDD